jgi:hypothetical protein
LAGVGTSFFGIGGGDAFGGSGGSERSGSGGNDGRDGNVLGFDGSWVSTTIAALGEATDLVDVADVAVVGKVEAVKVEYWRFCFSRRKASLRFNCSLLTLEALPLM